MSKHNLVNYRRTNLFATAALEGFRLCLLFRGTERVEQVFLSNLPVGSLSLPGSHFLTHGCQPRLFTEY